LEEPLFISRIIFKGTLDPASFFKMKPTRQALSALRSLDKGELDAVLVTDQQYASLNSLPFARQLEVIFSSDSIPLMGVVASEKMTSPEDRTRFVTALSNVCSDEEGKKLCDLFGVEAFSKVEARTFEPLFQLWKKGAKK
jgi:ABC-type phosphate/phosphonate transport system substrate-binding protein